MPTFFREQQYLSTLYMDRRVLYATHEGGVVQRGWRKPAFVSIEHTACTTFVTWACTKKVCRGTYGVTLATNKQAVRSWDCCRDEQQTESREFFEQDYLQSWVTFHDKCKDRGGWVCPVPTLVGLCSYHFSGFCCVITPFSAQGWDSPEQGQASFHAFLLLRHCPR